MERTVLILGGSGRFGRHAIEAFAADGWTVRRFDRARDNLWDAAWGAQVIVNGWNPPYPRWRSEVPALTARVVEVAAASGATVIVPGNVYVFGRDAPERFAEDTPHAATNPLGRVRVEMEAAYRAAGVRTIVLRAGDYLDTLASGNWFDLVMTAGLAKGRFTYPGRPDIPHAWAWLPDMARAAVALAGMRDRLAPFEDVPFPGYTLSGREMAAHIETILGRAVRIAPMNWMQLRLVRPFWPMARHLLEMRYLWDKPHHLDGARFARLLPDFEATPVERALASALDQHVHPDKAVA